GDEFVFEGARRGAVRRAVARIRARLAGAEVDAVLAGGTRRRLRSARVHAGIGRSLEEADAALMRAKNAGGASGGRAGRARGPRGGAGREASARSSAGGRAPRRAATPACGSTCGHSRRPTRTSTPRRWRTSRG